MQAQGQFITLRDGGEAKALVAPELGGWLLRYSRHIPELGYVDAIHYSQEVVDRYPNQMYAGNPLLFPMVSFNHLRGKEHFYEWQGQAFPLPQHGFARRSKWQVTRVNETSLEMELADSEQTLSHYPFHFRHRVEYELRDGRLHFRQRIENRSKKVMPFSTGIHPYFNVPLRPGSSRNDCHLEIPECRRVQPHKNWETWTATPAAAHRLGVKEDVSGTLFLTDLKKQEINLVDPRAQLKITLNWEQAPQHRYVAIWSKSTSDPFYCIEPWTALPNSFSRRETELILLDPSQIFEASMWMELSAV